MANRLVIAASHVIIHELVPRRSRVAPVAPSALPPI
jgi:hypothetical protein